MDQQSQQLLDSMNSSGMPPLEDTQIKHIRSQDSQFFHSTNAHIAQSQDVTITGTQGVISLRIYTPFGVGPFNVIVFIHGGGWVLGNLNSHDALCRQLCEKSESLVIAIDYRLAPEHPYPEPLVDCYDAVKWIRNNCQTYNGNSQSIVIAGDSAGGNLSAAVALMLRDRGFNILKAQILIYPVLDYNFTHASYTTYETGYFLTTQNMRWFWEKYVGINPEIVLYMAPLYAKSLAGLPPTLIIAAQHDPLYDEGKAYAQALKKADVVVQHNNYDTIHCFVSWEDALDIARAAIADIAQLIKHV